MRDNAWIKQRRELLAAQLNQRQPEICHSLRQTHGAELALPADETWLQTHFQAWVESVADPSEDVLQRWQHLAAANAERHPRSQLAWGLLDAARPYLGAADSVLCRQQIRVAEHNADSRAQVRLIGARAEQFCERIGAELNSTPLDFSDENGKPPALESLSWDLALLFQDWANDATGDALAQELRFIHLFCEQIIVRYSAAPRFWELLLLKLERALSEETGDNEHGPRLRHVLSYPLEALLGAVPRYTFLRAYWQQVAPLYASQPLPLAELLLVYMIASARPRAAFFQRVLSASLLDLRIREIDPEASLLEPLKALVRQGEETLRMDWERAQLDWYSDACLWLNQQVEQAHLLPQMLAQAETKLSRLSARISEGIADAESAQRLQHILHCVLELLCLSANLDANPPPARERLREHLALLITPDKQWPLWRKLQEITAALGRLDLGGDKPETARLWQQSQPLLNNLDSILGDLCRPSLNLAPQALSATAPLPTDFLAFALDTQRLYPRYRRRGNLLAYLLSQRLPNKVFADGSLRAALTELQNRVQAEEPALTQALDDLLADYPLLHAIALARPQHKTLARQASEQVFQDCANYAQTVGETGMEACTTDNAFILLRVMQVLSTPDADPQDTLLWWWQSSVGSYLVHREQDALASNLRGLRNALEGLLEDKESAQTLFRPIHQLYNEVLGNNPLLSEPRRGQQFMSLSLQGARREKLALQKAGLPVYLDDFTDCAEKYQSGGAPQGPLCLDLGSDDLAAPLQEQLQALLHIYLVDGDLEMALQNMLASVGKAQQEYSTDELEIAWRQLLALLPEALPIPRSAYWTLIFESALDSLRQAGLGRYLETHAERLGERLEAYVGHLTNFSDADRHRHHLSELCRHLGRILRRQAPTLAALNSTRYLLEQAMPELNYPAPVWHVLWQRLSALVLDELDNGERVALHRWISQWDAQSEALPATYGLGQGVFLSEDFVFAEDSSQEQAWRAVLSGLLAAAITPDDAPYSGAALAQRLLLSAAVFAEETAASWQERYEALRNAFLEQLPDALQQALTQRHLQISALLLRLPVLEQLHGLPRVTRFILALSEWSLNQQLWRLGCLIQAAEKPHYTLDTQSRFLLAGTGWEVLDGEHLRHLAEMYKAACLYQPRRDHPDSNPAAREELDIALRIAALAEFAPKPAQRLRAWLLTMLPLLETDNAEQAERIVNAWLEELSADPGAAGQLAAPLRNAWVAAGLVDRLIYAGEDLAMTVIDQGQPELSPPQLNTCTRDLGFLLRYLGLHIAGLAQGHEPATWYWRHVACFLPLPVRNETETLLPRLAETLGEELTQAERAELEQAQQALCGAFELPEWSQAGTFRAGSSGGASAVGDSVALRGFHLLTHNGPRWREVFSRAQPNPALLTPLAAKLTQLWPEKCQEPPLYIANLVSAQLTAFLGALQSSGGDEEVAWQTVQPLLDEALQQASAQALCSAWRVLAARLPALLGEADSLYWLGVCGRGETLLRQVALGRLLSEQASDSAAQLGAYFMERLGAPQDTHKCSRDLTLFLEHMAAQLRTQPPTLAALNISRYWLERIIPFVPYSTALWRFVWVRLEETLLPHADNEVRFALRRWLRQLDALAEHFPGLRSLALELLQSEEARFSEDESEEEDWRALLSGLLCAALTPEDAPLPGQALAQRLLLSSPVFAEESSESWQQRQRQLSELCADYLDNRQQVPLLMRHAQLVAGLMKLARLREVEAPDGAGCFAALLSGLHEAEAMWRSLYWGRGFAQPDYVPEVQTLLLSQLAGWALPSQEKLRQAGAAYRAACQFRADFPIVWHKWRLGGLLGRIDSDTLYLSPIQQQTVEAFLRRLAVRNASCLPEQGMRLQLLELFTAFADYLPEQREALVYHLGETLRQRYGESHPLAAAVGALSTLLSDVGAGFMLLQDSHGLAARLLPDYPSCVEDIGFLLRRFGLHLSGVAPCASPGDWYWQQIGVFLPEPVRQQARAVFASLHKALPKQLSQKQAQAVEPLVQDVIHVLSSEPACSSGTSHWILKR